MLDQLQALGKVPGAAAAFRKAIASPKVTRSKRVFGGFFWDRDLLEGSFRTEVLDPALAIPGLMERQFEILATFKHELVDELKDIHAQITCPTLLVWGEHDPFFPPARARAMVGQFAGPARFVEVPDTALLVHEEQPERVAELIRELLAEVA